MEKIAVWLLLCCPIVSVFAQKPSDIAIYVPIVRGEGMGASDNRLLTEMLASEIAAWKYLLAGNLHDADYLMTGSIAPYTGYDNWREQNPSLQMYVFHLVLQDSQKDEAIIEQDLLYTSLEDINIFFPIIIFNMLSVIPVKKASSPEWHDKWWYFGARAFWTPRVYTGGGQSVNLVNFGFGLSTELHFHNFVSTELGAELAPDWITVSSAQAALYRDISLEIPIAVKLVFKPGSYYMLQPYTGVHFNMPFYGTIRPSPCSWMLGFQYGVKAGQGVVFIDPRFSMDIGSFSLEQKTKVEYQRYIIHISAGYKYGVGKARHK